MKPEILLFDNYDSFTYNIAHALRRLGIEPAVIRNDRVNPDEIEKYDKIIISPGPGIPSEAGLLPVLLERYACTKPILGICLGHQAIGEHFGARLRNLPEVFHGVATPVDIVADDYIFEGIPPHPVVGRYHSWVVDNQGFPDCLEVTARSPEGHIMALRHRSLDVRGVQFHPESILTPGGFQMIENWIKH